MWAVVAARLMIFYITYIGDNHMVNYESERISYDEFCSRLRDFVDLYNAVEKVTCPQILIMRRDEVREELRELFCDLEDNLTKWVKGKPCTFVHPENKNRVEIVIGRNTETLYQFLLFCYDIHDSGKVNIEREAYLALLLSRDGG